MSLKCIRTHQSVFRIMRCHLHHQNTSYSNQRLPETLIKNLTETKNQLPQIITLKFNNLVKWYEEFTGLDEVRLAQNRVLQAEERFKLAQEKRREATLALSDIQNKLKDLYAELDTTTRGEDRYLHLITQEHDLLKRDKVIQENFALTEKHEREYFAAFSSAVKESHEKERAQAERTKYWSIIGSIIGTIIGIVGSSFNNSLRMKELRKLVKESNNTESINSLTEHVLKNGQTIDQFINTFESSENTPEKFSVYHVNQLKQILNSIEKRITHLSDKNVVLHTENDQQIIKPFSDLEKTMIDNQKKIYVLVGVAILSSVAAVVSRLYE